MKEPWRIKCDTQYKSRKNAKRRTRRNKENAVLEEMKVETFPELKDEFR